MQEWKIFPLQSFWSVDRSCDVFWQRCESRLRNNKFGYNTTKKTRIHFWYSKNSIHIRLSRLPGMVPKNCIFSRPSRKTWSKPDPPEKPYLYSCPDQNNYIKPSRKRNGSGFVQNSQHWISVMIVYFFAESLTGAAKKSLANLGLHGRGGFSTVPGPWQRQNRGFRYPVFTVRLDIQGVYGPGAVTVIISHGLD